MSPGRAVVRILFTGLPAYLGWFLANLVLVVFFPLFFVLSLLRKQHVIRAICVAFLRFFFLRYLPFVRMYRVEKTEDLDKLRRAAKCLLVANHTSWLDALILLSLVPNVRILVSSRYGKVPLVSRVMVLLGCIFMDRTHRDSVAGAVSELREVLSSGGTLAVFPEGTRAPKGELKPFRDVFFSLAKEASVKVVPVILYLDTPFLGPRAENFLTARCAVLKIRVLDAAVPEPLEKGRDLSFRVRRQMKRAVLALDNPSN